MDSVVDSFFPLVEEIGEQVAAIESTVYNEDSPASTITPIPLVNPLVPQDPSVGEKVVRVTSFVDEKHGLSVDTASLKTAKTQFSLPRPTCGLMMRRWRRAVSQFVSSRMRSNPRKDDPSFTRTTFGLQHMARTRRLATSVTRVLATKPEVVAGIRKRLLASDGPATGDDAEVAIYFGDVQGKTRDDCNV
jgi:magnesium transporter